MRVAHSAKWPVRDKGEGYDRGARFRLGGLTCPECAAQLLRALERLDGMKRAELNYGAGLLWIEGAYGPNEISRLASGAGLSAVLLDRTGKPRADRKARPDGYKGRAVFVALALLLIACGVAARALGLAWPGDALAFLPPQVTLERALFALALLSGGYHPVKRAWGGLWRRQMEAVYLVLCTVVGALLLDRWMEAAVVITLFAASELWQAAYMDRLRRFAWSLRELLPSQAVRLSGERAVEVPVEEIAPGDTCVVSPGETIPIDGVIVQGSSNVLDVPLTGAAYPSEKREGDRVEAGSVNEAATIHVQADRPASASALHAALDLLEDALGAPGPGQAWTHRFAAVASPLLLFAGLAAALLPPVVMAVPMGPWLYAGLIFLLVAQPCSLALSVPAASAAALVACAKAGVLARSGEALGRLAKVNFVAFDPGAVLTRARLDVSEILPAQGWSREEALALAAGIVWGRGDAIGQAIVEVAMAAETGMVMVDSADADEFGNVEAVIQDEVYAFGELSSLQRRGVALAPLLPAINALQNEGVLIALVVKGKEPVALFALVETVKESSRRALGRIARLGGVDDLAMVSESASRAVAAAAASLNVDPSLAGLRPGERAEALNKLKQEGKRVAVIGPPAKGAASGLAVVRALSADEEVEIVYGTLEAASRLGRADIMLVGDDLDKLPYALAMARRTRRVARQNVALALGLKAMALVLLASGLQTLWLAASLEFGAAGLVILNSGRLLRKIRLPGAGGGRRAE